jgi:SAM-dependent methyltransferase
MTQSSSGRFSPTSGSRLLPAAVLKVAPAEDLPLSDESADLVLSSVSFHHWTDQRKGLAEAGRILRLGGWLCLADIVLPRWVARALRSRAKSAATIQRLMATTGLQVETQERRFARVIAITSARKVGSGTGFPPNAALERTGGEPPDRGEGSRPAGRSAPG